MPEGLTPEEAILQSKQFTVSVLLDQMKFDKDPNITVGILPSEDFFPGEPETRATITVTNLRHKKYTVRCSKSSIQPGDSPRPVNTGWDVVLDANGGIEDATFVDDIHGTEADAGTEEEERRRKLLVDDAGNDGELILAIRRVKDRSQYIQAKQPSKPRGQNG